MNADSQRIKVLPTLALATGLAISAGVCAQVTADRPWVRATVANQSGTGAFVRLTAQQDMWLTGARSPVAGIVEIHEMKMDDAIMRMRPAGELSIKAGQSIELKPGGYHLMMMSLKQQLKPGDTVPLTLEFRRADGRSWTLDLQAIASLAAPTR